MSSSACKTIDSTSSRWSFTDWPSILATRSPSFTMPPLVARWIRTSPRLPPSGACTIGAKTFEKLRAVTDPVTRRLCCKTPRTAFTVLTTGAAAACLAATRDRSCQAPKPAITNIATAISGHRLRLGPDDGTICKSVRCGAGAAVDIEGEAMSNFYCKPKVKEFGTPGSEIFYNPRCYNSGIPPPMLEEAIQEFEFRSLARI